MSMKNEDKHNMNQTNNVFTPFEIPSLPDIPESRFSIVDFGAVENGSTLNTQAIAAAIEAAHGSGGGRVVVPAGAWLTGPIHLRSRIELHLEEGTELRFSQNPDDYLPVVLIQRGGIWCHNYSPFIYARDAHDVAVTGSGTLNGQGESWWPWKKAQPGMVDLFQANADRRPVKKRVYGTPEAGVRPPFFQAIECRNVLIDGVTFRNSPSWTIHPVCCENLLCRHVKVLNPSHAANTDGIDPDSCRNVLIEDCHVDTGDDGICLKSGRDADGRELARPCENVLIRRCTVKNAHGGFVIGSEMSGGVRNIMVEDCTFEGTDRGIRLKTRPGRGGFIENVHAERIAMNDIRCEAVIITLHYGSEKLDIDHGKAHVPNIQDVLLRDIECSSARTAGVLNGVPGHPIRHISLQNLDLNAEENGLTCTNVTRMSMEGINVKICI